MLVTVLIPIYNTPAAHLLEAFFSVLNQDDKKKHPVILIDDGSTSAETKAVLNSILDHSALHQSRAQVLFLKENKGTAHALNQGHQLVKTEFVAIMGSSDISHPTRFSKQINYLQKNPKVDVLGTNLFSFHDDNIFRTAIYTSSHPEIPKGYDNNTNWLVNHGTVIYRDGAVKSVGGYDENWRRGQDVNLWGRMKDKYTFRNLTEVLYAWRK